MGLLFVVYYMVNARQEGSACCCRLLNAQNKFCCNFTVSSCDLCWNYLGRSLHYCIFNSQEPCSTEVKDYFEYTDSTKLLHILIPLHPNQSLVLLMISLVIWEEKLYNGFKCMHDVKRMAKKYGNLITGRTTSAFPLLFTTRTIGNDIW